MKLILASLVLSLVSLTAFACPEINATYVCNYNGVEQKMEYTTRVENNVYIYKINLMGGNGEAPADGVSRRYGSNPDLDLSLTCADSNLFIKTVSTNVSGDAVNLACLGSGVIKIEADSTWDVTATTIVQHNKGKLYCGNGAVHNMGGEYTCVKQ